MPLSGDLQVDDSALETDGNRVRAIIRCQLLEDVGDVAFHRILSDGKLRGDVFIGVAGGNQPENVQFARRQFIFAGMVGQLRSKLGRDTLMPGMHGPDGVDQFPVHAPF